MSALDRRHESTASIYTKVALPRPVNAPSLILVIRLFDRFLRKVSRTQIEAKNQQEISDSQNLQVAKVGEETTRNRCKQSVIQVSETYR